MSRSRLLVEWGLVFIASMLLVGILLLSGATSRLDNAFYDVALRFRQQVSPPDIIIVAVDDASLRAVGRWPWSRSIHAALIDKLGSAHPRAIAYDVLFVEPGPSSEDAALAKALARTPVFLPVLMKIPGDDDAAVTVVSPISVLRPGLAGVGQVNADLDPDGIVRRVFLHEADGKVVWPYLMLSVAQSIGAPWHTGDSARSPPDLEGGLSRRDEVLIPFLGPPGTVKTVSAGAVLRGEVLPIFFAGKVVLVGATAAGLRDGFPTPTSGTGAMPGVEVQANALAGLIAHQMIIPVAPALALALSLGVMAVFMLCLLRLTPRANLLVGGALAVGVLAGSATALAQFNFWIPPASCVLGLALTLPVWGWRRLNAASVYFAAELRDLQSQVDEPGGTTPITRFPGDLVLQQMTLLRQTHQRIANLQRFVGDVLEHLPDAVMAVDMDGRVLLANQSAQALADRLGVKAARGVAVQSVLARLELLEPDGTPLWPPPPRESTAVHAPGDLNLEIRYAPTHDGEGTATGWIVQLSDVSQLLRALRQREEALQLFTHDMRAPQSAILALLERPELLSTPEPLRHRIAKHAHRTIALANGFVQLARAQSADYVFEPVDLAHMLGDATDELWPVPQAGGVTIKLDTGASEYPVLADRTLLTRALINLLDNAVKFSGRGTTVRCELRPAELDGRPAVACEIADQGCGMTPHQLSTVFSRFTQHVGAVAKRDGVGLGLALVHSVVVRHHGRIQGVSQPGTGTRFTLILPLDEVD